MNEKGTIKFVATIIIAGVFVALLGYVWFTKTTPTPPVGTVVCPQDANICPDGSAVGRTGPNCEFAACPTEAVRSISSGNSETANWKTYRNEEYGFEVKYPIAYVVSENRPAGVPQISFNSGSNGFTVTTYQDLNSLYGVDWQSQGEVQIDRTSAKKLFRPLLPGDTTSNQTAYLINAKNISITFLDMNQADEALVLSTFKFTK